MKKQLISVSDIIKQGWHLYIENLQLFLLPVIIMLVIPGSILILEYFQYYNLLLYVLIIAISIFISLWVSIYIIKIIDNLYNKKPVLTNELLRISFHKIPGYFWVSFLAGLVILFGLILIIIPGIIFAVWFEFAPYINILEEKNNKGLPALKQSKLLVKGNFWTTLWRLMAPAIFVYIIVMIIVAALTYLITGGNIDLVDPYSQANMVLNGLSTIILTLLAPLFISFIIILYNSLKQAKKS